MMRLVANLFINKTELGLRLRTVYMSEPLQREEGLKKESTQIGYNKMTSYNQTTAMTLLF